MSRSHLSRRSTFSLQNLWTLLIEPASSIEQPDRRRQSRLLSFSLLTMTGVLALAIAAIRLVPSERLYPGDEDLVLGGTILASLLLAYALNRKAHYALAALLAVVAPEVGIFAATVLVWLGRTRYYETGDVNLLVYTIMPVLFASMLLSVRALVGLVLFNAVVMVALPAFFRHIAIVDILLGPLLFSLAISALVLLVTRQRNKLERDRRTQLTEQKERYQSLFNRVPVGLYRTTPQGEILDANTALVNLLGFTDREALLAVPITDLFVDQSKREQELAILKEEGILRDYEIRLRRWDGGIIWAQDTCRTVRDSEGQLLYFEGGLEDITKRKRTEEALRESEERFRNIFENAPIGIYRTTPGGQITMANPTLVDMLGYDSFTELSQRDLENEGFLSDHPRSVFKRRIAETGRITGLEAAWKRKDGATLFVRENARAVRDQDGTVLYYEGTVEDITERKEMEERLRRQERLAAIGQMAGGIAHDFRNFLTSIILYAQLPLRRSDVSPDVETSLETIVSEAQQAANLVQQILDFSRRSTMKTELIDLYQFTKEVTHVLQETIPETIDIRLQGTTDCCPVKADPTRIQQVLMNLTLNARDAMPEGGNLLIRLHRVQVEANEEPLPEIEPGQWICLTVSDTGTGLSEEAQEHLFEPFFTTKEPGKGTGLGLAQVYGIVRQHEGYIDVQTAAGEGTTFRIYLPLHQDEERPPREKPPELVPGHGELILLVEDEREVREAARQVLESLGYRVLTAANGRETEALARERDLDLLLTDLVMPDMDGWALIKSLKKRQPDLKTIAMTGYALEDELQDMAVEIIQKPLDSETLSQAIRRALDGD